MARVNQLANMEALLNFIANGMEILGVWWGDIGSWFADPPAGQPGEEPVIVLTDVYSNGSPLAGATVAIDAGSEATESDGTAGIGPFHEDLPATLYGSASKSGYGPSGQVELTYFGQVDAQHATCPGCHVYVCSFDLVRTHG